MANRPRGFGMTAELAKKKAEKFDAGLSTEVLEWIAAVLETGNDQAQKAGEELVTTVTEMKGVSTALKSGYVLALLANTVKAGTFKTIKKASMAFKQMEMISQFLQLCEDMGCKKQDIFQTVDLYESQNIPQVINGLLAFGRKAWKLGYVDIQLGPEEAVENKRDFDEDTLNAGKGIIGLQMGSNKGASQAGQNFGKTRMIID